MILFTKVSLDVDAGYDEGMKAKKKEQRAIELCGVGWGCFRIFTKEIEDRKKYFYLNPTFSP